MGWWRCSIYGKSILGDGPANIMSKAINRIIKEYKEEWDREPTMYELHRLVDFVAAPLSNLKKR